MTEKNFHTGTRCYKEIKRGKEFKIIPKKLIRLRKAKWQNQKYALVVFSMTSENAFPPHHGKTATK